MEYKVPVIGPEALKSECLNIIRDELDPVVEEFNAQIRRAVTRQPELLMYGKPIPVVIDGKWAGSYERILVNRICDGGWEVEKYSHGRRMGERSITTTKIVVREKGRRN